MKILSHHHEILHIPLLLLLLSPAINFAAAQPSPPRDEFPSNYATFSPSMAIIIVVLIAALFFMGFFSIYIRHCSDSYGAAGSVRRALSLRSRRAAAARGLDPSVLESFPILSYAEVKDHQIGKGALECAVCLNEFEETETLRLIPKCDHVFHPECIDAWLESHVTCPVCRANLDQTGDEPVPGPSEPVELTTESNEIAIDVVDDNNEPGVMNRSSSLHEPVRASSVRRPKLLGKFRSHSTGHSLVQPGQNLDRFTLRLPEEVRKGMMDRAALKRTGSLAGSLPRVGSSRKGYRTGGGEGSGRAGRFYRRMESDRWVFFSRGLSMKSPKVADEGGESSSGGGIAPVKLPSFRCLEPKTADETGLLSGDSGKNPV